MFSAAVLSLASCGGGGSDSAVVAPVSTLAASSTLQNLCAAPRPGSVDTQGTLDNEKKAYLRSFTDETYLWYKEVPTTLNPADYATPAAYFDVLKTAAKTASGRLKDQFHWSVTQKEFDQQTSGITEDYGIQWAAQASAPPRKWIVASVVPASPAAQAGIRRGDLLTSVDGVDFVSGSDITTLNNGLFPSAIAPHSFGFTSQGIAVTATLTPATIDHVPVQNVKTVATPSGTVGYFSFDEHIAKSEPMLIDAINQLKAANVTDLVLDLRYNGGGLLYIASQLSYMIAGPTTTSGKTFEKLMYNDKLSSKNEIYPFYTITSGYAGPSGVALPTLGLKKK
ncbi:PDZ domain-containing protein [Undibacterium arcticum]